MRLSKRHDVILSGDDLCTTVKQKWYCSEDNDY